MIQNLLYGSFKIYYMGHSKFIYWSNYIKYFKSLKYNYSANNIITK
jgi:hypothetical protein